MTAYTSLVLRSLSYPPALPHYHHQAWSRLLCGAWSFHMVLLRSICSTHVSFLAKTGAHAHTHTQTVISMEARRVCFIHVVSLGTWIVNVQMVDICWRNKWVSESALAAVTQTCSLMKRNVETKCIALARQPVIKVSSTQLSSCLKDW